ncbi:MAG: transferase, partial [Bacteroidota bacterium]
MYLLFPGRHHLLTNFQFNYLRQLIDSRARFEAPLSGVVPTDGCEIEAVIFAVTSANHSNTRRNPIPFHLRAMALQDFAEELGIPFYVFGINDVGYMEDFAGYTIKFIEHETDGFLRLSPNNTLVLCSTPVLEMYQKRGYTIFKSELDDQAKWSYKAVLPWEVVEYLAKADIGFEDAFVQQHLHPASLRLWQRYRLLSKLKMLFADALISADGDLTTSRDYNSYVRQMDEIAELKYSETATYVQAGRIGDIGCAVGSW